MVFLSSGIDLNSKSSTHVTKVSQDAFVDIVESTRGFLPSYFRTTFRSGRSVEGTVSEKLRSGQLLQLYGLSLHQMHFQMHWTLHLYYISSGLQSRTASLHQNCFLIIPHCIKIVFCRHGLESLVSILSIGILIWKASHHNSGMSLSSYAPRGLRSPR